MPSLFDQISGFSFPDVLMNSGPLPSTAGGPAGSNGSVDGAPRPNLLLAEDIDTAFAAPLDRVIPLDAVVAWRAGPDERDIVATVPVPAGAVFKTAVL
jgi:hypothetical protein